MAHIVINSTAALESFFGLPNPAGLALTNLSALRSFFTAFDLGQVTPLVVSASLIRFSSPSGVTVSIEGSNFGPITSVDVGQAFSDFVHMVMTLDPNFHATLSRIALTDTGSGSTLAEVVLSPTSWTITSGADVMTITGNLPTNFTQVANAINEIIDPATGQFRSSFDAATSSLASFGITDITVSTSGSVDVAMHWTSTGITITAGDFVASVTGTLPTNLAQIAGVVLDPGGAFAAGFSVVDLSLTQTSTGSAIMSYTGPVLSLADAATVILSRGTDAADVIDSHNDKLSIFARNGDDTINLWAPGPFVDGGDGYDTLSLKGFSQGVLGDIFAGYSYNGLETFQESYFGTSLNGVFSQTFGKNIENFILTDAADDVFTWTPVAKTSIDLAGGDDYLSVAGGSPIVNGSAAVIDGGSGRDTLQFLGPFNNYGFVKNGDDSYTISGQSSLGYSNGAEVFYNWTGEFKNFEKFIFTDKKIYIGNAQISCDFDGSGTSDVLLRNETGVTYLWSMNGATVSAGTTTTVQVGNNWQIEGIGDFDGNGTSDILWLYENAADAGDGFNGISYVSFQNGAVDTGGGVVQQLTGWSIVGVADFTGDGKSDVLYRSDTTGQTYLDVMYGSDIDWSTSGFTSAQVTDTNWTVAAVDDFDGDGMADVLWRYSNAADASDGLNGTLYEWTMNGTNVVGSGLLSQQASGDWQVAGTGDFDGNGAADILFRYHNAANASDPLNGLTYVGFMDGTTVTSGAPTQWQVGEDWQLATIGDFDGDSKSDILWQQTSTGATYAWMMDGTYVVGSGFTSAQAGTGWTAQNGVLIG